MVLLPWFELDEGPDLSAYQALLQINLIGAGNTSAHAYYVKVQAKSFMTFADSDISGYELLYLQVNGSTYRDRLKKLDELRINCIQGWTVGKDQVVINVHSQIVQESLFAIAKTASVIILLAALSASITKMVNKLVVRPIERMTAKLAALANSSLSKVLATYAADADKDCMETDLLESSIKVFIRICKKLCEITDHFFYVCNLFSYFITSAHLDNARKI